MCHAGIFERELDKFRAKFGAEAAQDLWDEWNGRRGRNPKRFKMEAITYPGMYAPVIRLFKDKFLVEPMRYGIYGTRPGMTNYVARRDNLRAHQWADSYRHGHGFVIAKGFLESVEVKDLIKGGVISIDDVKEAFEKDREGRKAKVLAEGRKYKETDTEKKDPLERSIEIELVAVDGSDLLMPVIFNTEELEDGGLDCGFAVITDPAPKYLCEVGKDRRPILIDLQHCRSWLRSSNPVMSLDEALAGNLETMLQYRLLPKYGR